MERAEEDRSAVSNTYAPVFASARTEWRKRKVSSPSRIWWLAPAPMVFFVCACVSMAIWASNNSGESAGAAVYPRWIVKWAPVAIAVICLAMIPYAIVWKGRLQRMVQDPFGIKCGHCGKHIASDISWVCGYCDGENTDGANWSFLHMCLHCHTVPKALRCHFCAGVIYFDGERDDRHCAYRMPMPQPGETLEQAKARRALEQELHNAKVERINMDMQLLQATVKKTTLERQVKSALTPEENNAVAKIRKSVEDRIERYKAHVRGKMMWMATLQELRAEIEAMPEFKQLPKDVAENLIENVSDEVNFLASDADERLPI